MNQLKGRAILRGKKLKKECHKAMIFNLKHNVYACGGLVIWNDDHSDYCFESCCLNCKAFK